MFTPLKILHNSDKIAVNRFVPNTFGLICWNVHKNNNKEPRFKEYLKSIKSKYDFMLFQEANFKDNDIFILPEFSYYAAANIKIKNNFFGVLTASKIKSIQTNAYLSEGKEGIIGTRKSLLISNYLFEDFESLLILNVHTINFRENRRFIKEMERFISLVNVHKGPLIVAGDFNTWSRKRLLILHELRKQLGLKMVKFDDSSYIKSFMGNQLDFIFYRDLKITNSWVDITHNLSDHNPLFVEFTRV